MLRRHGAGIAGVALAFLLGGCGGDNESGRSPSGARAHETDPRQEDAIAVRVAEVRREPVSAVYSTSTTLRSDRHATVIARTEGVIRQLRVEEGDRVEEAQVLAVLEDDEQRIEAERTRASFDIEHREFERAEKLYDEELLSNEDLEAARRELEEARHARARADLELERTVIRSPFTGTILNRHVDVGATVADGVAVYDLADLDPLYADVNIPERHVARLAPGQSVRLTVDASGAVTRAGIKRIAPSVDPATGTVKVTLISDSDSGLRPGTFVRADIVTETHENAVVVPRSALVAEGRRWNLFRLDASGQSVELVEVALGFEEGDRVEIGEVAGDSEPLQPGDRVVTVGAPALSDGTGVTILEDGG